VLFGAGPFFLISLLSMVFFSILTENISRGSMIKGYVYRDITFILNFANYLRGSLLPVWFNYPIFGPLILVSVAIAEF
jgi:hypothetical protein